MVLVSLCLETGTKFLKEIYIHLYNKTNKQLWKWRLYYLRYKEINKRI